jgi:DNA-binding LacI/PurR family transcriptional regulator
MIESAAGDAGLSWEDVPVYESSGSTKALGRAAARALLALDPRPTAILATSDQLALGAIEAAVGRGLSVPDDVSVAGFDDVPLAASAAPALTTVYQDHAQKGHLAGGLLAARLRGQEAPSPDLLPARLVIRGSSGRAGRGRRRRRPSG